MNNFTFFGTDEFSIEVLKVLISNGFKPAYCITQPDRPKGRDLKLTPPDIKVFCEEEGIEVLQFEKLDKEEILKQVQDDNISFHIVASYGKIIPKDVVEMPRLGTLNVHPSLLPKYRGASPIETAILRDDKNTGVTIMLMDEKMDHGPIVEQESVSFDEWPTKVEMRDQLAKIGGEMLTHIIPQLLDGKMKTIEQDHDKATFTKMIQKSDGLLEGIENSESKLGRKEYLKYLAYNPWPGTFFFIDKKGSRIRVKITKASFKDGEFKIERVIPEGKKEMDWESFRNGYLL
jgi:methionyl-tRNA formyltransferase